MTLDRFVVVPAAYVFLLRPSASAAAGVEVLLQRRGAVPFMAGHWAAAAAGHVERGEDAYAAARREAREELGLDGVDLHFLTAMQRTRGGERADPARPAQPGPAIDSGTDPGTDPGTDSGIDERIDFFFTARSWSGEPRIMEPVKATDLGWFPLDSLPDPTVPHEAEVLRLLAVGSVPPYMSFGFT